MRTLFRSLLVLPILTVAFAFLPYAQDANAACLSVSRGRVLIRKVGSRYRMTGGNFYFNMSCTGSVSTGYSTLASGTYCTGTRLRSSKGGTCKITSIFIARNSAKVGLPLRSATKSPFCKEIWQ
jgi:hypothetical protein